MQQKNHENDSITFILSETSCCCSFVRQQGTLLLNAKDYAIDCCAGTSVGAGSRSTACVVVKDQFKVDAIRTF